MINSSEYFLYYIVYYSWQTKEKYSISPTFPQLFNTSKLKNIDYFKYNIEEGEPNKDSVLSDVVTDIPMMTRLACDSSLNFIANRAFNCLDTYRNLVIKETNYEEDEIFEIKEDLKRLRDSIGAEDENNN